MIAMLAFGGEPRMPPERLSIIKGIDETNRLVDHHKRAEERLLRQLEDLRRRLGISRDGDAHPDIDATEGDDHVLHP